MTATAVAGPYGGGSVLDRAAGADLEELLEELRRRLDALPAIFADRTAGTPSRLEAADDELARAIVLGRLAGVGFGVLSFVGVSRLL